MSKVSNRRRKILIFHVLILIVLFLLVQFLIKEDQKIVDPQSECQPFTFKISPAEDLFKKETIPIKEKGEDDEYLETALPISDLIISEGSDKKSYLNDKYVLSFVATNRAFAGKVNASNVNKDNFVSLMDSLLASGAFDAYQHLEAEGCPSSIDKNNPSPRGMTVTYMVNHKFCTKTCQVEDYEINIELNNNGEFIGYVKGSFYW